MGKPRYQLIKCRTALNRVRSMPFRWSLNPYRGCQHACRYCYARLTHTYLDLGIGRDFEEIIFVKENLAAVLRSELRRPGWRYEPIAIGTATDPYQPAEGCFQITRRCLEVLADVANPCSITTKGTLIVRDSDVLQQLAAVTNVSVHVSLITLDPNLWRRVEPGTPPPESRLQAITRLRAAGVPVRVFLMPVLPGLTDRPDQIAAVVRAAAEHGATGVATGVLRLAPGVREWFLSFLRQEFPHLVRDYTRWYGSNADAPLRYRERITQQGAALSALVEFPALTPSASAVRVGRQLTLPW